MFIGAVACGYKYAHFTRPTFPSSVVAFQLHGSEDEDRSWKGKPSAVRRQASGGKRQASGVDRICTPTIWAFFLNIGGVSFPVQLYREADQRFFDPAADELVVWESLGDNSQTNNTNTSVPRRLHFLGECDRYGRSSGNWSPTDTHSSVRFG